MTNEAEQKQSRRDLNRRLAERLVAWWSGLEYHERFDDELALAIDGKHDGVFDINALKYKKVVGANRAGGTDAHASSEAARQERKVAEASFSGNGVSGWQRPLRKK